RPLQRPHRKERRAGARAPARERRLRGGGGVTYLPTTRDEEWRYADPVALAELTAVELDAWKEIALAPGEVRRHCTVLDDGWPGLSRVRLTVGEGARAELFAVA